ncbi:UTRA domain-containing protein [Anderseniella sp. Alg231-50]|uniref:UTRA domain-containing protein n=1 Tax=Anderseniella sp. Alg231-50 TaxID=1922226 RepID=UPI000D554926
MTQLDTNSWQGIKSEVMRRINSRRWQPGDLIPGEVELAEEFGCARATVNRALRELADSGLLDRKRKAGTRVALNPVRKATVEIPVIRQDVESRGKVYSFDVLDRKELAPSAILQQQYALAASAPLLGLWTLHRADTKPFAYEERWINLSVVPEIVDADLETLSANEWLVRNMPLSRGEFTFSAANATAAESQLLDCPRDAAVFIVNRSTFVVDDAITAVRLVYGPGYSMRTVV